MEGLSNLSSPRKRPGNIEGATKKTKVPRTTGPDPASDTAPMNTDDTVSMNTPPETGAAPVDAAAAVPMDTAPLSEEEEKIRKQLEVMKRDLSVDGPRTSKELMFEISNGLTEEEKGIKELRNKEVKDFNKGIIKPNLKGPRIIKAFLIGVISSPRISYLCYKNMESIWNTSFPDDLLQVNETELLVPEQPISIIDALKKKIDSILDITLVNFENIKEISQIIDSVKSSIFINKEFRRMSARSVKPLLDKLKHIESVLEECKKIPGESSEEDKLLWLSNKLDVFPDIPEVFGPNTYSSKKLICDILRYPEILAPGLFEGFMKTGAGAGDGDNMDINDDGTGTDTDAASSPATASPDAVTGDGAEMPIEGGGVGDNKLMKIWSEQLNSRDNSLFKLMEENRSNQVQLLEIMKEKDRDDAKNNEIKGQLSKLDTLSNKFQTEVEFFRNYKSANEGKKRLTIRETEIEDAGHQARLCYIGYDSDFEIVKRVALNLGNLMTGLPSDDNSKIIEVIFMLRKEIIKLPLDNKNKLYGFCGALDDYFLHQETFKGKYMQKVEIIGHDCECYMSRLKIKNYNLTTQTTGIVRDERLLKHSSILQYKKNEWEHVLAALVYSYLCGLETSINIDVRAIFEKVYPGKEPDSTLISKISNLDGFLLLMVLHKYELSSIITLDIFPFIIDSIKGLRREFILLSTKITNQLKCSILLFFFKKNEIPYEIGKNPIKMEPIVETLKEFFYSLVPKNVNPPTAPPSYDRNYGSDRSFGYRNNMPSSGNFSGGGKGGGCPSTVISDIWSDEKIWTVGQVLSNCKDFFGNDFTKTFENLNMEREEIQFLKGLNEHVEGITDLTEKNKLKRKNLSNLTDDDDAIKVCEGIKKKLLEAQTKVIFNIQKNLEGEGLKHGDGESGFQEFFKNFQVISESVNGYLGGESDVPVNLSETSDETSEKKLSNGEIIYLFWPLMFEAFLYTIYDHGLPPEGENTYILEKDVNTKVVTGIKKAKKNDQGSFDYTHKQVSRFNEKVLKNNLDAIESLTFKGISGGGLQYGGENTEKLERAFNSWLKFQDKINEILTLENCDFKTVSEQLYILHKNGLLDENNIKVEDIYELLSGGVTETVEESEVKAMVEGDEAARQQKEKEEAEAATEKKLLEEKQKAYEMAAAED